MGAKILKGKNARALIFKEKWDVDYRLERGYIPKGTREIRDCKTLHFKTLKSAVIFAKKWLKNRRAK